MVCVCVCVCVCFELISELVHVYNKTFISFSLSLSLVCTHSFLTLTLWLWVDLLSNSQFYCILPSIEIPSVLIACMPLSVALWTLSCFSPIPVVHQLNSAGLQQK